MEFNLQHMEVSEKEVFQQFLHTYEDTFAQNRKAVGSHKVSETSHRHWRQCASIPTGVNARIEEIHGRKEQLVHVNRLKRCLATEVPRDQLARTGEANRSGEKLTTGQPEFPPAEEPTSSGHPREVTVTTGPPEDFEGPITRTQETTGTPRTATTGAEAGRRAVPDYGTEFGDGWRGLFTPAFWNQEGGGLSRGAEQPRGPQADLEDEEYLPNPISQQGRSPVSQDLVVFKL
ncbi:hypothetical protein JTB14_033110 [Gonioctena quinquepunctata]|nr:hypothetical protein JTB14_033110 [Gonioctena quinquepunctata]